MKKTNILIAFFLLGTIIGITQQNGPSNTASQKYLAGKESLLKTVFGYFYKNQKILYSLPEKEFVLKIDSLRNKLTSHLGTVASRDKQIEKEFIQAQQNEIHYLFDAYILGYPYWHGRFTGQKVNLSLPTQKRLDKNLIDFNNPGLLSCEPFRAYVTGFLYFESNREREKPVYKDMDNQKLNSIFHLIPVCFTNQECRDFWSFEYLNDHLENIGVKNTDEVVKEFNSLCKNTSYSDKIQTLVEMEYKQRAGHLIKTYKTVGNFDLDLHIFLPENVKESGKRPVYVFFHGGSWTEGKPDFGFNACDFYAKSGYVAAAVEYRINDRHGTLPFESVMDARSAIRWLRKNAAEYNIDIDRIVATGNSAGGHLVLCAALADKWNEKTDDLQYSPVPNILLVNSGVFDLTGETWITNDLKDKSIVKEISPTYLVKKGMPPTLFIHAIDDRNVSYQTAKVFDAKMKEAGNDYEFHSLEGVGHFFWYDEKFYKQVSNIRVEFLKKHGYE